MKLSGFINLFRMMDLATFRQDKEVTLFFSFQVFLANWIDITIDPLSWSGFLKSMAYVGAIDHIFYSIYCSANFFAYQFLSYKEKKLQKDQKQEREMERRNPTSTTHPTGNTSAD